MGKRLSVLALSAALGLTGATAALAGEYHFGATLVCSEQPGR